MDQATQPAGGMLTLERALDVLEVFSIETPDLGLVEISRSLNVPKSSVFRYLAVLERRGYVQRRPDGRYTLGVKFLGMGNLVRSRLRIADIALAPMEELRARHGETVNLAVLDHGEIVHVEVLEGRYGIKMTSPIGSRAPAHSTSLGKAILAFSENEVLNGLIQHRGLCSLTDRTLTTKAALCKNLEQIRQAGYAKDDGESEQGLYCIGAPIFDSLGHVYAAISVSGPALRMQTNVEALARDVMVAAAEISSKLGSPTISSPMKE